MTATTTTGVRLMSHAKPGTFAAFVDIDGRGEVRVRFRRSETTDQWRCDECGAHRFATCTHERAAVAAWREQRTDRPDTKEN